MNKLRGRAVMRKDHLPRNRPPKKGTKQATINPESTASNMHDDLKPQERYYEHTRLSFSACVCLKTMPLVAASCSLCIGIGGTVTKNNECVRTFDCLMFPHEIVLFIQDRMNFFKAPPACKRTTCFPNKNSHFAIGTEAGCETGFARAIAVTISFHRLSIRVRRLRMQGERL